MLFNLAQLLDGVVEPTLVLGDARLQQVRIREGRRCIRGAGRRGTLALALNRDKLVKKRLCLVKALGAVGDLRLHKEQVEIFRRALGHGLKLGQRRIKITPLRQLAGNEHAKPARPRVRGDKSARILQGLVRIDRQPILENAHRGLFRARRYCETKAGFRQRARRISGRLCHVGQCKVRGKQVAPLALADRTVKDIEGRPLVGHAAEHGGCLADRRGLVLRVIDPLAQRGGQPAGLSGCGRKGKFGRHRLGIIRCDSGPGACGLKRTRQVSAGKEGLDRPPGQTAIAGFARKFEHGRARRDVLAPLERNLCGKDAVKQAGRQRNLWQLSGPQANDLLLLRHGFDLQRHILRHATGLPGRLGDLCHGGLPDQAEREQRTTGDH